MTPSNKLISIIAFGIILFFVALWLQDSFSNQEAQYIKLGGLSFHTSLDEGIREGRNQSKPIFLYFRSETCYWCIVFEKESLSDPTIIDILNKNFVLISIDTLKQQNIAENLNVRTTPYMIFFDKNGEEISRIPGYIPRDEFNARLDDILKQLRLES